MMVVKNRGFVWEEEKRISLGSETKNSRPNIRMHLAFNYLKFKKIL